MHFEGLKRNGGAAVMVRLVNSAGSTGTQDEEEG